MSDRRVPGYSGVQIVLHWLVAALVALQLLFGDSMAATFKSVEGGTVSPSFDQFFAGVHYWVGIAILTLVSARLWLRVHVGAPPPHLAGWMAWTAKLSHAMFYVILVFNADIWTSRILSRRALRVVARGWKAGSDNLDYTSHICLALSPVLAQRRDTAQDVIHYR